MPRVSARLGDLPFDPYDRTHRLIFDLRRDFVRQDDDIASADGSLFQVSTAGGEKLECLPVVRHAMDDGDALLIKMIRWLGGRDRLRERELLVAEAVRSALSDAADEILG